MARVFFSLQGAECPKSKAKECAIELALYSDGFWFIQDGPSRGMGIMQFISDRKIVIVLDFVCVFVLFVGEEGVGGVGGREKVKTR